MTSRRPKRGHGQPLRDFALLIAAHQSDDCLDWPWTVHPEGYGQISVGSRNRKAHQVALELAGMSRPGPDYEVRHLCGRRICCNPRHLRWGTKSENQRDRFDRHGASHAGERNNRHHLTAANVRAIRARRRAGEPIRLLAAEFGVAPSTISMATTGQTWTHLAD